MKAYTKKSHVRESANDKIFGFVISLILILFAVITAIPLISEVAVSLSSKTASQMNQINLLPVGFTFDSWKYLFMKGKIWTPFLISVSSTVLGVAISIITKCFNGISVVENRIPTVQIYYVICGIYYGVCCS